jgi:hypothetical protein
MTVSASEFRAAQSYFTSLDIADANGEDITVIGVTIEGINGSKSEYRRSALKAYRLLVDVSDLASGLPEAWVVSPKDDLIEHANIFKATRTCPLTRTPMPRICWGTSNSAWVREDVHKRTLGNFLEVARQVLSSVNLDDAAR